MFQHPNHRGTKKRRGTARNENLFEKIMKENFPNLLKEINFQEVQEAQRVPKKSRTTEAHTKAHHNTLLN